MVNIIKILKNVCLIGMVCLCLIGNISAVYVDLSVNGYQGDWVLPLEGADHGIYDVTAEVSSSDLGTDIMDEFFPFLIDSDGNHIRSTSLGNSRQGYYRFYSDDLVAGTYILSFNGNAWGVTCPQYTVNVVNPTPEDPEEEGDLPNPDDYVDDDGHIHHELDDGKWLVFDNMDEFLEWEHAHNTRTGVSLAETGLPLCLGIISVLLCGLLYYGGNINPYVSLKRY